MNAKTIEQRYTDARSVYAERGVDTERALRTLGSVSLSLHCWQGDDVGGFERLGSGSPGGGLQVTGAYPGKARNVAELQSDLELAFSLIPGRHRLNLHAIYGDFRSKPADRDALSPEHFTGWAEWAAERGLGADFNATWLSS